MATIERTIGTILLLGLFSCSAFALDAKDSCKDEIKINGEGAYSQDLATRKAKKAWSNQARIYYGDDFANAAVAFNDNSSTRGVEIVRCSQPASMWVCEVRGRPCNDNKTTDQIVVVIPSPLPLFRDVCRFSPQPCDPEVKWVQRRLIVKGYDIVADGRLGDQTRTAIRQYKNSQGHDGENIDSWLLQSLRA